MNREIIAREILTVAKELVARDDDIPGALDGLTKQQAKNYVNKILRKHTQGLFKDDYWRPIHKTFEELDRAKIEYDLYETRYSLSPSGRQTGLEMDDTKTWKFKISFINQRGRENILWGIINAHGAGTMEQPLDSYDISAYVT